MDIVLSTFREAFGYEPPRKPVIEQAPERQEFGKGSPYYATDALGREFFMPVKINDILIPFAVVSIECRKTIVSTPMVERGGSVRELISIDDYRVNVKGILINDSNDFPEDDIITIQTMVFLPNQSVTLTSVITDIFLKGGFDSKVVIEDVKWPGAAAVEHARAFEINCSSDMLFTLKVDGNVQADK